MQPCPRHCASNNVTNEVVYTSGSYLTHRFVAMIARYLFLLALIFSSHASHIGYPVAEQMIWSEDILNPVCDFGRYQSPIHIKENYVDEKILPALEFVNYRNYLNPPLILTNNGHTVALETGNRDDPVSERPYLTGSVLSSKYVFEGLHFHWGSANNNGSEHMIYSMTYPLEMHLVHRNILYNNTDEAKEHKDGLVVLGVLFNVRLTGDNHRLKHIVNHLKYVADERSSYTLFKTFPLSVLLPSNLNVYFVYEGSLTTVPCSEAVTWFVFPQTIPISQKQMQLFRRLPIADNFRKIQEIGQRKIILRRFDKAIPVESGPDPPQNFESRSFWLY